jgi:outer membrane protein TolC
LLILVSLSGCTFYHEEPLPRTANLLSAIPVQSLGMERIAQLALANSPDLIAARRKAEVSEAQAYAAGLLPDPQFTASADQPMNAGPGVVMSYALGVSEDLQALLTEPSRAATAAAKREQAKLDLLWMEWQTIQNSATLVAQKVFADQKTAILKQTADVLTAQSMRSQRALITHDLTIDVAGSDLSAALDLASQVNLAQRTALTAGSALRVLVGMTPNSNLSLAELPDAPVIREQDVAAALSSVAKRRPDLLALEAGYRAQEESVRTAILQQFPAINLGFNRGSDNSNISSNGLSVTFNIPIFGSTQAKIRTERATRAQLRAEYQARLDQAQADAWRIWRALALLREEIQRLDISVPDLRKAAQTAQIAYQAGDIAPATYVLLQISLSARESELLDLRAMLWSDTMALRALIAMTPLIPGVARSQ